MGPTQSNTASATQQVLSTVAQSAYSYCDIEGDQVVEGNTITKIGGSGNITISQALGFENSSCNTTQVLETQIQNILDSMAQQSATSVGSFLDFTNQNQNVDLHQSIRNALAQQMFESCQMGTHQTIRANYVFAQDTSGDINLTQKGNVTGATCAMSAVAKAVIQNKETAKIAQKSSVVGIFGLMMIVIIIVAAIVFVVVGIIVFRKFAGSNSSAAAPTNLNPILLSQVPK